MIKYLIEKGANVNFKEDNGLTYLMKVILINEIEICKLLLENGADVNTLGTGEYAGLSALDIALNNSYTTEYNINRMIDLLYEHGATISSHSLDLAMKSCNYDVIHNIYNRITTPVENEAIDAALKADSEAVVKLAKAGKINKDSKVIFYTAAYCSKEALKSLLECGFDINTLDAVGNTLLTIAASYNTTDVVEYLLVQGASLQTNKDILEHTIQKGNVNAVRFIIEKGYILQDIEYRKALLCCMADSNVELFNYLTKEVKTDKLPDNIISVASAGDSVEIIKLLIEQGFPINEDAIMFAIQNCNWDLIKLLIENGANVNCKASETTDTPLNAAIKRGNLEFVQFLVEKGADVNQITDELTPLIIAASSPSVEIISFLLSKGADLSFATSEGKTALDYAKENNWKDNISILRR